MYATEHKKWCGEQKIIWASMPSRRNGIGLKTVHCTKAGVDIKTWEKILNGEIVWRQSEK